MVLILHERHIFEHERYICFDKISNMNQAYVKTSVHNRIARIEFYHPAHNSLPGNILVRLSEAIEKSGDDPEVHFIILQSGGDRTFCAGASFDELLAIKDEEAGKAFFSGFARVINTCRRCPKIILGRVQGKAVGGGVGLAAATDYCFATKYSSIKLSELAIGIGPFVIGPAVQRKMGLASFSQLALNAYEWQNAYWARDHGLYTEVYDDIQQMDEAIDTLSLNLLKASPAALAELKRIFWKGTMHWNDLLEQRAALSGTLVLSTFTKEALRRIKKK